MKSILIVLLAAAALALPLAAHHSFAAEYDGDKPVTVKGVVSAIDWRNPHAYIMLDIKDETGGVHKMQIEGHPPNILRRTGWLNGVINVNDEITVSGWAARDGAVRMAGRQVTLPNGKKLFWGPPSK